MNLRPTQTALIAFIATAFIAHAQEASSPPKPADQPVQLSVFEVSSSQDVGYQATNTLSGTRTGERLQDVPVSISVLTPELMADVGALNFQDIAMYAPGVQLEGQAYSTTNTTNRGVTNFTINGGGSVTRNFLVWVPPLDLYNLDRIEVIRGPNSVLYGVVEPGGVSNAITKQAIGANSASATLTVGPHDGGVRVSVDIDRKISDKLAFRVNALDQNEPNTWRSWEKFDQKGVDATSTWRPFQKTVIRFDYEYGRQDRDRALPIVTDDFSAWNGTPITPTSTNSGSTSLAATGTSVVAANAATARQTWIEGKVYNLSSVASTYRQSASGTTLPVLDAKFGAMYLANGGAPFLGASYGASYAGRELMPSNENWVGPNGFEDWSWGTGSVSIEQPIGPLKFQFEASAQNDRQDRERPANVDNVLRIDPNTVFPGNNQSYLGDYYMDLDYLDQRVKYSLKDMLATVVYDADLGFTKQRLLGSANYDTQLFTVQNAAEVLLPGSPGFIGTTQYANNAILTRVYLKDGNANASTFGPPTIPGLTTIAVTTIAQDELTKDRGLSLASLGEYWQGKVHTMIGYRKDFFYDYHVPAGTAANVDPVTGVRTLNSAGATNTFIDQPSLNYGVVVAPVPHVSVYVNHSASFLFTGSTALVDNTVAPPRVGHGNDAGLRFDLWDSRITAGVSIYNLSFTNNTITVNSAAIQALRALSLAADPNSTLSTINSTDTVRTYSTGTEFELTANPLTNWRLFANYSLTNPKNTNTIPRVRTYWAQVQANVSKIPTATYAADAPPVQSFLASEVEGGIAPGIEREAFNLVSRYDFTAAPLKDWFVIGGMNWRSAALFGGTGGITSLPSYKLYNASVGRQFLIRRRPVSLTLEVRNLFDQQYLTGNSFSFLTYGAPREVSLTATVKF